MAYGRKRFTERDVLKSQPWIVSLTVFRQHRVGQSMKLRDVNIKVAKKYELPDGFKKNQSVKIIEVSYIPLPTGLQRKKRFETFPLVLQHSLRKRPLDGQRAHNRWGCSCSIQDYWWQNSNHVFCFKQDSLTVPFSIDSFWFASISPRNSDSLSQKWC